MENSLLEDIKRIYEGYLADTVRLEKNRSLSDGLMGFGKRLDFDPCHDAFAEQIEKRLIEEAAKSPSSKEILEVLRLIYKAPSENKSNILAYWMLIAVQKHTESLVRFLTTEDALTLSCLYAEIYPKSTMLPVQKEIAELLQMQSGNKNHVKSSFFNRKKLK